MAIGVSVNQGRVVIYHPNSWEFVRFLILVEGLHIFLIFFGLFAFDVKMVYFLTNFFIPYYFPFFFIYHSIFSFVFIHLYFIHGFPLFFNLSSPIYSIVLFQFFSFLCCALYLFHNVDITIFWVCRSFVFLIIWKNNLFFHYLYIVCFEVSNVCLNVQLDFLFVQVVPSG